MLFISQIIQMCSIIRLVKVGDNMEIIKFMEKLGIVSDNLKLYQMALTHTSYSNEHPEYPHYERLEFLGDAVLELIMSDYLYNEKYLEEGMMTKMRASYVCENALYKYALSLDFPKYVRVGEGIKPNATILADMFEALIGAIYLDQGFERASSFVLGIIVPYIKNGVDFLKDYKSELQELVQTVKKSVVYEIVNESGPSHNRTFECVALVDGIVMGRGISSSKKGAEQEAAKEALSKQAKV